MKTFGVLGGGQLARMLALSAVPLGYRTRVIDPSPDAPAAAVADHICAPIDDADALDQFCDGIDTVTYEMEHIPAAALDHVSHHSRLHPPRPAIAAAADRLIEKQLCNKHGIETAGFAPVGSHRELEVAIAKLGTPFVLKTRTHGYDGKGQQVCTTPEEARAAFEELGGTNLIAEQFVTFDRELSIAIVRSLGGDVALYPLVENYHEGGILRWTIAPAPNADAALCAGADEIAKRLALALDYVGVLVVELFQVGEKLLVNEYAPRVHNSAHWTIEGSETSQFENHVRAIMGLPLGSTAAVDSWVMFNILSEAPDCARVLEIPGAHLHLYDKAPRLGRKLGHVNCRASEPESARPRLQAVLGL